VNIEARLQKLEAKIAPKSQIFITRCNPGEEDSIEIPEGVSVVAFLPHKKPVGAPVDL
jgi:hypothetical protein